MNDPNYAVPSDIVCSLALDAATPLYPQLRVPHHSVPHHAGRLAMHGFLKAAIESSRFAEKHALWEHTVSYANHTLSEETSRIWLSWLFNGFTGVHPADVDLSGWLMALDHYHRPHADWTSTGMSPDEIALAKDFINIYFDELNEPKF
ncbi:hypothetical protein F1188_18310 [Roseospira marina]|uniref:Uncharacterized protein n=1 Tax=Roseospira marina TaxID=140057 RepID=A0A5M6I6U8_9PROT|nr:hypothetical protein [Roseospira marina]KAA5603974.1 hypothetical protein F1188_18310 [Roseospira marina]MBB4315948.1 hypothetical protein [Roseospira marina]MBB5089091.1 hypothetical protein [Roseospira marina]